ncbi:MAG: TonB C-terminal domain-containing protein [Candidatus Obscuribacterales bacterium]|nr:TonB C-terminal domain-containing protein [Candidatus Obscuribacterales bacterium]
MKQKILCIASLMILSFGQLCQAAPTRTAKPAATKQSNVNPVLGAAYTAYVNNLQPKIGRTWNYPDGNNHVVLSVTVAADGSVSDLKVTSTPNNVAAEQAGIDAFNQAQPLAALPANSPPCRLTITFDSNADPHGDAKAKYYVKLDALTQPPAPAAESATPAESESQPAE